MSKPKFKAGDILIEAIEFAEELELTKIVILKVGKVDYLYKYLDGARSKYSGRISYYDIKYIKVG